jgi:hypothetical protein
MTTALDLLKPSVIDLREQGAQTILTLQTILVIVFTDLTRQLGK